MLHESIQRKAKAWFETPDCKVKAVVDYIRSSDKLRVPQIEAIEVYLYLKLIGQNASLSQMLSAGLFSEGIDLGRLEMSDDAKEVFRDNPAARSIFEFVREQSGNKSTTLSPSERLIAKNSDKLDFESISRELFYEVEYPDYLFSLPMGAGKTFLMAAIMYLDLYFAQNEPDNKLFAHNFLVLVPSGLKSSIVPSLKTIERFDPAWVIPEPSASNLKRLIKFEVLDEAKAAKKSNKAKNPNVQKIARHQPFDDLMGLILVVNAEKVILDKLDLDRDKHLLEAASDDEKAQLANELRTFIGKIPNIQIHIDEVHHATDSDIKLRQVVNKWSNTGNVNSVLGYSGTPYLEKKEKIAFGANISFQAEHITNTVYYYSLLDGIKTFLKKPTIKSEGQGLNSLQIVRKGVEDFIENYGKTVYSDGTIAKLAIYCGTIERLETEIFPFLTGRLGIPAESVLKYHKGNREHPQPTDSELEFKLLDEPVSKKQIILLVQIGKEGWDCRSLTGVILSQANDCPKNMVLQTSCRCLRQVERGNYETALIWLSKDNAETLNKQLAERQKTNIAEINRAGKEEEAEMLDRYARLEYLRLPKVDFYQLRVEYETVVTEMEADPKGYISSIKPSNFQNKAIIQTTRLSEVANSTTTVVDIIGGESASFSRWLVQISKESFDSIKVSQLKEFESELNAIFEKITTAENGSRKFNELVDLAEINKHIRLAFHSHRELNVRSEIIPDNARMLIVEKLQSIPAPKHFLPSEKETKEILEIDAEGLSIEEKIAKRKEDYEKATELLRSQGLDGLLPNIPNGYTTAVECKDRSFHFLPYKFDSGFEKDFLEKALCLDTLKNLGLEIYFNGEKDITDFRIACYTSKKKYVGRYTPDFLVIKRIDGKIHKVLILETKGKGFAEQTAFTLRREFVESEFLKLNNDRFKYDRFDYLYLTDADSLNDNLAKFNDKVKTFFKD
jgi:type III restriction enzyme